MKIVKEHINEIKRDTEGTGLGAVGIGRANVNKKLKEHVHEFYSAIHDMFKDAHSDYIAKLLKLDRDSIKAAFFKAHSLEVDDYVKNYLDEAIDTFGPCDLHFTKVQRGRYNEKEQNYKNKIEYYIWKELPTFVVEVKEVKEDTVYVYLYCNKNVFE